MALIDRTIYPVLNDKITEDEILKYYTPSDEEIQLAYRYVKGLNQVTTFLTFLKLFKQLRYFPKHSNIPTKIINHINTIFDLDTKESLLISEKTFYKYKSIIKQELHIKDDLKDIKELAIKTVEDFEPIMENPADVFNAVIEILIKNNCELPSFSTLDRIINTKRNEINNTIFDNVEVKLNEFDKESLNFILEIDKKGKSLFNYIKELPKSPTLNNMKSIKDNYLYLKGIKCGENIIKDIHPAKVKYFASQAKALDAAEMKKISDSKRHTILICFIYNNTVKTLDDMITMFIKRIGKIHNKAKENLELMLDSQRGKTESMIEILQEMLLTSYQCTDKNGFVDNFKNIVDRNGGYEVLIKDCTEITAYNNKNYYPLLWKSFKSHRKTFFQILSILSIGSTTDNKSLVKAIEYLLSNESRKSEFIDATIDLSFANQKWQKIIRSKLDGKDVFSRRYFEICVFSYIASEFKTGDIYANDSDEYADYRDQLLTWDQCIPLLDDYCKEFNLPIGKDSFIENLQSMLADKCNHVNNNYDDNVELSIQTDGEVILKRKNSTHDTVKIKEFKRKIEQYMPERNMMEILCNVEHWVGYTKHFGPLSGSEPKLKNPKERYIILTFGYGSNMGPTQTSKHIRGNITPHMIHFTNKRHISEDKLDRAIADIINEYNKCSLPKIWGDINVVAADGTQIDMYSQNLLSENHIRYGGMGAIAYHHVSDTYIALFSHFIPCGVWEAVYIIDGLLKNKSDINPNIVHGDTQGQSSTVFALTYMLGIKLMPRIRNWKELKFYKVNKEVQYNHIEALFKETINWNLIDTHYKDLFQVVLSIKSGKILPSTLLRKLNNDSKKNKLFQAFRELGRVIRTIYLLEFISNVSLRDKITESTNKTEAYNGFSKWFFFGGEGIVAENDPEEQNKIIKYNELLSNAVILQNVIDINNAIEQLSESGTQVTLHDIKSMSPYMTGHIKRFGEYIIDLESVPSPIHEIDIQKLIEN